MSAEHTADSINTLLEDVTNSDSTPAFFKACVFKGEYKQFKMHLDNNELQQRTLDVCLVIGLRDLQRQDERMPYVVAALELVLQHGAKWDGSSLLDCQRTPFHVISQCPNDNHELLSLMMKYSGQTLLDAQDFYKCTAVMYAVQNGNANCLRCLIFHGADVNLHHPRCRHNRLMNCIMTTPLIETIWYLDSRSQHTNAAMTEIFDLLLDSGVDVNKPCCYRRTPIEHALEIENIECVTKLIQKGAKVPDGKQMGTGWLFAASSGSIDVLTYLMDHGIDKNHTDEFEKNALWYAVCNGKVAAIQYLLELGVTLCKFQEPYIKFQEQYMPCIKAIAMDNLPVVKLLERYGCQTMKSFAALRHGVLHQSSNVVGYLLSRYKYPLNKEYSEQDDRMTILVESCRKSSLGISTLLMEHGAYPISVNKSYGAIHIAITAALGGYLELIARFIRSGVDVDYNPHHPEHDIMLPFKFALWCERIPAAEMLLLTGCSCGRFNLQAFCSVSADNIPRHHKLMMEWKANNVKPLLQLCRKFIVNRLYPVAHKKINELPLPPGLIKYLGYAELDDIINGYTQDSPE